MMVERKTKMIAKFTSIRTAFRFSYRTIKASAVILGDDEKLWVVTLAKMDELLDAGYELAIEI